MPPQALSGRCVCGEVQYVVDLGPAEEARTSLCHCSSCKRAFGTNYGLTTKVSRSSLLSNLGPRLRHIWVLTMGQVPLSSFEYTHGEPKTHKQSNGVVREFCQICGTFLCEFGVGPIRKTNKRPGRLSIWGEGRGNREGKSGCWRQLSSQIQPG